MTNVPKKERTNDFLTKDFLKINASVYQMTIQEAKKSS